LEEEEGDDDDEDSDDDDDSDDDSDDSDKVSSKKSSKISNSNSDSDKDSSKDVVVNNTANSTQPANITTPEMLIKVSSFLFIYFHRVLVVSVFLLLVYIALSCYLDSSSLSSSPLPFLLS
jgi:hypothetical protein